MKLQTIGAALLMAAASTVMAQGQDAEYQKIVDGAKKEGKVVLYAPIDAPALRPVIEDFQSLYPGVTVEYTDLQTSALYNRYLSEIAAQAASADLVWNTPMDLQFKLVQDGNALTYASREKKNLPDWAVWNDQLYSITLDPGVFVYNNKILKGDQIPQSHADLVGVLEKHPDVFEGRIVSYDIEKAAGGFLMVTQDAKHMEDFWRIPTLFGKLSAQFPSGSGFMIETVGSGENVFGYNQLGSASEKAARTNPSLGIIYPKDFVVLQARTGFISKAARNPNAAKLLLDYLLSARAQKIIADTAVAYAVNPQVTGELTLAGLYEKVGKEKVRPITIGPELVEYLDPEKRTQFLRRWQDALRGAN